MSPISAMIGAAIVLILAKKFMLPMTNPKYLESKYVNGEKYTYAKATVTPNLLIKTKAGVSIFRTSI